MRKLLTLFLLTCTLAMWAEGAPDCLYIAGDATGHGWNLNHLDEDKLQKVSDNVYEWTGFLYHCNEEVGRKEGFKILSTRDWHPAMHPSEDKLNIDTENGGDVVSLPYRGDPDTKWNVSKDGYYTIRVTLRDKDALVECEKAFLLISSAEGLKSFAEKINQGVYCDAKLTQDIDYGNYTTQDAMIGNDGHAYSGIFDGQNHKVTVNFDNNNEQTALFRSVNGGTVQNLKVDGTISTTRKFAAGICAHIQSRGIIQNCESAVNITDNSTDDGTHGGIVAYVSDKANEEGAVVIKNCLFSGELNAPNRTGSGGILGWPDNATNNQVVISNCLVTGNVQLQTGADNDIIVRNYADVKNCYYLDLHGLSNSKSATAANSTQKESGELAFLLNGSVRLGEDWYQNLDKDTKDAYPVPFSSHNKVCRFARLYCDRTHRTYDYTNNDWGDVVDTHPLNEGLCACGEKIDETWFTPTGDWYEISNARQLRWVASAVNHYNNNYGNKNYRLTADINYSEYTNQAVMIGRPSNTFKGTFDGQNHTVTVAFVNNDAEETGLFRRINGGTVKNLKVAGTITTNKKLAGGIASGIWQTGTIQNCESAVTITDNGSGDATHGGILAAVHDNSDIKILNCLFSGILNAPNRTGSGGILGWPNHGSDKTHIHNCLVSGTVNIAKDNSDNDIIVRNEADVQNCYYLDLQGQRNKFNATAATSAQAESGELCYLLNGSANGVERWYQKKGTDNMPTPFTTGNDLIYANGNQNCDGTPNGTTFDNTDTGLIVAPHSFAANNLCENCHKAGQEPGNVDGVYQIATIGHLVWFADHVNGGNTTAAADVTADIAQGEAIYTPIGSQANPYKGVFKGGFHTILLALDNADANNQGIFGVLTVGAEIYNLTAAGSVKGAQGVGGIAGSTTGGDKSDAALVQFINCGNEATVNATSANAGGILGVDMGSAAHIKMINCYNAGAISGASDNGGLSGWAGDAPNIINCYNIADVEKGDGFIRCNGNVNFHNTWGKNQITNEMLSSGELCYRLGDVNFRQEIGTDAYPVLSDTKPNVFLNGSYVNVADNVTLDETKSFGTNVDFDANVTINRTMKADKWNTFCVPVDMEIPAGWEVKELTNVEVNGENYGMTFGDASSIEAGKPYMVRPSAEVSVINAGSTTVKGALIPTTIDGLTFSGAYENDKAPEGSFIISNNTFYLVNSPVTLKAFRGYITVAAGSQVKALNYIFDDTEDSIGTLTEAQPRDGEEIYNLAGQRIQKMQRGVNIVNGKKVLF